ncbi:MAG: hypothetical protein QOJ07_630 [Thermoleophilaceae bacterium]|nr:hypothetical protein [Thermoleophilaceae bacterium]
MPVRHSFWKTLTGTFGIAVMLLLASAGSAMASATVRFVHAVPGAGSAQLHVSSGKASSSTTAVSFGTASTPLEVPGGSAQLVLEPAGGGKAQATLKHALVDGARYTVVAIPKQSGKGASLSVFEDGKPRPGKARLRMIHATPELGNPDVKVDDRIIAAALKYGDATDYASVPPGNHDIAIARPRSKAPPLVEKKGVPLTAGTSTTAIVLGSRGEQTRIVTLSDGTAAPKGAPATGLGGLAGPGDGAPSRWLIGLMAALAAAALGAGCWTLAGRR